MKPVVKNTRIILDSSLILFNLCVSLCNNEHKMLFQSSPLKTARHRSAVITPTKTINKIHPCSRVMKSSQTAGLKMKNASRLLKKIKFKFMNASC